MKLQKLILHLSWASVFMTTTLTVAAHNKVVVIPLGGDEAPTSKMIFWTDQKYDGDLGGVSGADEKCQLSADTAGVKGIFKAWIGVSTHTEFTPARPGFSYYDLPYTNVDGSLVADNFLHLFSNKFERIIESVSGDAGGYFWTGLTDRGEFLSSKACMDWTSQLAIHDGTQGFSYAFIYGFPWSNTFTVQCGGTAGNSLICFEQ